MRIFVPMLDPWDEPAVALRERLVPYRCGVAVLGMLLPQVDPTTAAVATSINEAKAPATQSDRHP